MSRGRQARPVPLWWADVRDGFLRSLRRRNRRPNTLKSYRYELGAFGAWMEERGVKSLVEIRGPDIEAWQDHMVERNIAPSSQIVRISALRGCLKWAALQELPLASPTLWLRIESPRVPSPDPRPIPRRDLALIMEALEQSGPAEIWTLRTRALFWVLFTSGARLSEALSLRRGETDPDGCHVVQKGGRPHILLMSRHAIAAVEDYDRLRGDDCPMMFASLLPGHAGQPVDKFELQKCWNRLCRDLNIARFTTHQIRHSCGTTMRRNGTDIVLIAKQFGHRGLAMVQRYVLIDVEDRQEAVAALDGLFAPHTYRVEQGGAA